MCDIFFYEAFEEEQEAIKRYCPNTIRAGYSCKTIQELNHSTPPAPTISIRTQSLLPVQWAGGLHAILSRSAGYDHLSAYRDAINHAIQLGYLPEYCAQAVAEQALTLWMALLRKLPQQMNQFRTFHRDGITGSECKGRNLLVVGVGTIGYHVVQVGYGMGMNVLGTDLIERHPDVDYVSFEDGLKQADIVVCAMNLTADNKNYFCYEKMKHARPNALFINIARGELAFARDILRLIDEKCIAGAAMDVYNCEAELSVILRNHLSDSSNPEILALLELEQRSNVILTPHNAFNSREAVERKAEQSIQQLLHLQQHKAFLWPIPA